VRKEGSRNADVRRTVELLRQGCGESQIADALGVSRHVAASLMYTAEPIADPSIRIEATPTAVVQARDLGALRWERIAARAGVSRAEAKALYREGGGDSEASWTGRGRPPSSADPTSKRAAAITWLASYLSEGEKRVPVLKDAALAEGLSWPTLRRAADAIGVARRRVGWGAQGQWFWYLPAGWEAAAFAERGDTVQSATQTRPRARRRARSNGDLLICDNCGAEVTFAHGASVRVKFHDGTPGRTADFCSRCAGFLPGR
jgi:hypothetical protein